MKVNNLNQSREERKRAKGNSVRVRLTKMNNPEYFAKTFLIAGLILIVGASSFMNNPDVPKILLKIGIGIGVFMNILAGLLYYSMSKNK